MNTSGLKKESMGANVRVILPQKVIKQEQEMIISAFADTQVGLEVVVESDQRRGIRDELPLMLLTVSLAQFLQGFLQPAAADAYMLLKELVKRLSKVKRPGSNARAESQIGLEDPELDLYVVLSTGLSDHAWRRLFEIDWAVLRPGAELRWDERAGDWVDVTD
jgi:hypothetical protein